MILLLKEISVKTTARNQLVDITPQVKSAVKESKIKSGLCVVYCPHTTAAITINENADPDVKSDILKHLEKLVPENANYSHSEGNSDAHIKSALIGNSRIVLIENNELVLGTWGAVFFAEFDGPRQRKVLVKMLKE